MLKLTYFQGQVEAAEQPEQASEARPGGGDRPDHHRVRLHPLPQPQVRHQHGGAVRRGRGYSSTMMALCNWHLTLSITLLWDTAPDLLIW